MANRASGHGLAHTALNGGVGIEARYDDGTACAFSQAQVFAPGSTQIFAEGLTDREGRFFFGPNTNGVWRFTVDDGMGHALDQTLTVADGGIVTDQAAPHLPRWSGALAGVGAILGIFGLWALRRRDPGKASI